MEDQNVTFVTDKKVDVGVGCIGLWDSDWAFQMRIPEFGRFVLLITGSTKPPEGRNFIYNLTACPRAT